jgi:hypothetical protein
MKLASNTGNGPKPNQVNNNFGNLLGKMPDKVDKCCKADS